MRATTAVSIPAKSEAQEIQRSPRSLKLHDRRLLAVDRQTKFRLKLLLNPRCDTRTDVPGHDNEVIRVPHDSRVRKLLRPIVVDPAREGKDWPGEVR